MTTQGHIIKPLKDLYLLSAKFFMTVFRIRKPNFSKEQKVGCLKK